MDNLVHTIKDLGMKIRTQILYMDKNNHNCICLIEHIQENTDSIYNSKNIKAINTQ